MKMNETKELNQKGNESPNLLISSLFTVSTLYSSARDLQRTTLRKDEFLPRHQHKSQQLGINLLQVQQ